MKKYKIYDFRQGEYVGADRYYYTEAKNPIEAIRNYMRENKIVIDTNTRFVIRHRKGIIYISLLQAERNDG
jgi:hypothetical protein